jgi:REP element-mobilizing transposase RayT
VQLGLGAELTRMGVHRSVLFCEVHPMPRQLRQDGRGATHHVFIRGVRRSVVAVDAADYERALFLLERMASNFELICHAWCYLPNHSHLLVTSQEGNLSKGMHWLGTCTAQSFNRRHKYSGHVYQGRFESRIVEDDKHLLELARYLPLNPVRAGLCESPEDWPWSSYAATTGARAAPWFLNPAAFLSVFASVGAYVDWVAQGVDSTSLDDDGAPLPPQPAIPLATLILDDHSDDGLARAHFDHGFSQAAIARHLGVSAAQVCRRIARRGRGKTT